MPKKKPGPPTASRISAGLLMFRAANRGVEVLLVHPGGPYFRNKDDGAWTIPKGEVLPNEEPLEAAQREFAEETGLVPTGPYLELTPVKQKGGKTVCVWAFAGDGDPEAVVSNTFVMEWPPRSGRKVEFPEINQARFFDLVAARRRINPAQAALMDELAAKIGLVP